MRVRVRARVRVRGEALALLDVGGVQLDETLTLTLAYP